MAKLISDSVCIHMVISFLSERKRSPLGVILTYEESHPPIFLEKNVCNQIFF